MTDLPVNRLKAALRAGRPTLGLWLAMADPVAAEIAGGSGFDWCVIDAEHGPNDIGTIAAQLVALAAAGCEAVVRVPANDPVWIGRVLDAGARTVLVPMVNSAAEARAAVAACRYPPHGHRGVGAALTRAARWGAVEGYASRAEAEISLIVMAETAAAVKDIDGIAATDGVEGVFVGPADLGANLGLPPGPELDAAILGIHAATRAAGKAAGEFLWNADAVADRAARGVTMIAVGAEVLVLSRALRALASQARAALPSA